MTQILDGKKLADELLENLKIKISKMSRPPKLTILQIGENDASKIYVRNKIRAAEKVGLLCEHLNFPPEISQKNLIAEIQKLNSDENCDGMILQLPIPPHLNSNEIFREISPQKDADGFCAYNLGKMFLSKNFEHLPPATPAGIIRLLEKYEIPIAGKIAVVVGASNIVGKPISIMLKNRGATTILCDEFTPDISIFTKMADILISATGVAKLIKKEMVRENAVLIDVGMNRDENGKLCGDVDFENVAPKVAAISPVPGGVGPMTIASLILNVCAAAKRRRGS
jgi:methylenetetrahydrofolate dehydrogenase (NADP+)/methenyltetrahydrofolate cyclohydrolase